MAEADGYILRIASKQWVEQVFNMAAYYTSLPRKWKKGQTILFMHKTNNGDSIIGYGIIETVYDKNELSNEEKSECKKYGWKKAIEFSYVIRFEKPLLVKETFLKDTKLRGRYFHGLRLNKQQLQTIIS
ncbi:MAG TPA: hypothetical protein VMT26_05035 [Candidatus Bathyarchaeia archaeon]|jgi:hypothetical protein|nr:hypothetical protein [Candidatus Bathyarchaeia archaeon]